MCVTGRFSIPQTSWMPIMSTVSSDANIIINETFVSANIFLLPVFKSGLTLYCVREPS